MTYELPQSIMSIIKCDILMRHRCPGRILTYGSRQYVLSEYDSFFAIHSTSHEVSVPYRPERTGTAEHLLNYLTDVFYIYTKTKGLVLRRNSNISVSAYHMVPHCATCFLPVCVSLCPRINHIIWFPVYLILFWRTVSRNSQLLYSESVQTPQEGSL